MKKAIALLAAVVMLTGCSSKNSGETFATINGNVVTEAEYILYLDEAADNFEAIGGADI